MFQFPMPPSCKFLNMIFSLSIGIRSQIKYIHCNWLVFFLIFFTIHIPSLFSLFQLAIYLLRELSYFSCSFLESRFLWLMSIFKMGSEAFCNFLKHFKVKLTSCFLCFCCWASEHWWKKITHLHNLWHQYQYRSDLLSCFKPLQFFLNWKVYSFCTDRTGDLSSFILDWLFHWSLCSGLTVLK